MYNDATATGLRNAEHVMENCLRLGDCFSRCRMLSETLLADGMLSQQIVFTEQALQVVGEF
jgi:hypothetical protein